MSMDQARPLQRAQVQVSPLVSETVFLGYNRRWSRLPPENQFQEPPANLTGMDPHGRALEHRPTSPSILAMPQAVFRSGAGDRGAVGDLRRALASYNRRSASATSSPIIGLLSSESEAMPVEQPGG